MKIVHLTHFVDLNGTYERSLKSKIFRVLEESFDIIHILYVPEYTPTSNKNYRRIILPFNRSFALGKIFSIAFMYYNNLKILRAEKFDMAFLAISPGPSTSFFFIYKILFPRKLFYIQLATPSVTKNKLFRKLYNNLIKFNLKFFKHIGSGTDDNLKAFGLNKQKVVFFNPGYYEYGFLARNFKNLNLIYLGTLSGRNIADTIHGLRYFLDKHQADMDENQISVTYDIIGGGKPYEIEKVKNAILQNNLSGIVTCHGFLDDNKVTEMFKKVNIGIAYLPNTEYYTNLPSTKIVEYFLSGMAVISVDTKFAREMVVPESGVLCEDNALSFADALEKISLSLNTFNSADIRLRYQKYSMSELIKNDYVPKLKLILEQKS